jgi:hypothetical protein
MNVALHGKPASQAFSGRAGSLAREARPNCTGTVWATPEDQKRRRNSDVQVSTACLKFVDTVLAFSSSALRKVNDWSRTNQYWRMLEVSRDRPAELI